MTSIPPKTILNDEPVGSAPLTGPLTQSISQDPGSQPYIRKQGFQANKIQANEFSSSPFSFDDPGNPRLRLSNLVKGIQYKLEADDGISESQSQSEAYDLISKLSKDPEYKTKVGNYLKTGGWDHNNLQFLIVPKNAHNKTEDQIKFEASQEVLAKRGAFTAAMQDYVLEPLSRFGTGAVQGTFIDPVIGVANLFGAEISPWSLKDSMRAASQSLWTGKSYEKSLEENKTYAAAQEQMYNEKGGIVGKTVRGLGDFMGAVVPFMVGTGEVSAGLKVAGSLNVATKEASLISKAYNAAKAAIPSRVIMRAGEYGAEAITSRGIWTSFKLAQNPTLTRTLLRSAGAFGAYEAAVARNAEDPNAPARMEDVKAGFIHGATIAPLMHLFGTLGRSAYTKILTSAGKEGDKVRAAVSNFTKNRGIVQLQSETDEAFLKRSLSSWVESGAPGAKIPGARFKAYAAQASIESLGLNSIDADFWGEGFRAFHDGDWKAAENFISKFVSGAIGTALLQAGRLEDVPRVKRDQVNPLRPNVPSQEIASKAEPAIQPGYKVDELGVPIAPPEQISGTNRDIYTEQVKPTEYKIGRYDEETGTYFPESNIDLSQSGMHGNDLARHGFRVREAKETLVFKQDDIRRENLKSLSSDIEGEATVNINAHTAENILKLGLAKDSPARKSLQDAIDNGSADVTLSAKELKSIIDYHTRRAPGQRAHEGAEVAQPKIQSVDIAVEKYLQAFGKDTKPINAPSKENVKLAGYVTEELVGKQATIEKQPATESQTIEIPNSPHYIELSGGKAYLSPYLSEVLGAPREINIKDLSIVNKSLLASSLRSKVLLPGIKIDTNGTTASEGKHKVIRFNEVLENDGTAFGEWKPSKSEFASRPKDEIDQLQQQHVIDLLEIKSVRDDLKKEDQELLGSIIEAIDSVAAHKDPSVKETLDVLPLFKDAIENAPPEYASFAIDAVAKLLTNASPNVALKEYSESIANLNNMMKIKESNIKKQMTETVSESNQTPEQQIQKVEAEASAKLEEFQSKEAAQLRNQAESEIKGETTEIQQPIGTEEVQAAQEKLSAKKSELNIKEEPPVKPSRINEGGFINVSLPKPVEDFILKASDAVIAAAKAPFKWVGTDIIKRSVKAFNDVGETQIAESIRKKGYKTVSDAKQFADEANAAGGNEVRSFNKEDLQEAHSFVSSPSGQSRTTKWFAGGDEHAGVYYKVNRSLLNSSTQKLLDLTHNVSLKFAEIANKIGLAWKNGNGKTGIAPNKNIWRLPYELTPTGIDMIRAQNGPVWDAYVAAMKELHPSITEENLRSDINNMMAMGTYDNTEFLRKYKVLPTQVRDMKNKDIYHTIFYDTPKAWNDRIIDSSSQVLAARANFHDIHDLVGAQSAPANRNLLGELAQGQPVPASGFIEKLAMKYGKGSEVVQEAIYAMRSLHGMNPELNYASDITPGSAGYYSKKGFENLYKVATAAKLTVAGVGNLVEPIGHAQQLGLKNVLSAYKLVLESIANGNFKTLSTKLANDGYLKDKEMFKDYSRLQTSKERIEYLSSKASEIFMSPFELSQSFAEVVIAEAARVARDNMMSGQGTAGDRMLLSKIGFSRSEAEAMTQGRGTAEQYDMYKRMVVQSLTASSMHPALRTKFMTSKNTNALLRFVKYFANKTGAMVNEFDNLSEAIKLKDNNRVKEHSANILLMAGVTTAAGVLSKELTEFLFHGPSGVMADLRKYQEDFGSNLTATFANGMFGGMGSNLGSAAKEIVDNKKTTSEIVGEAVTRTIGPVSEFMNFIDFAAHRGEYKSSRSIGESLGMYLEKQIPASRALKEGLFGIGAIALGSKDPDFERTRRQYAQWAKDNDETHFITGDADESTYEMMKASKDLFSTNKDKFINAHKHIIQSMILKFKNNENMSMEEAAQAARQSLLNKRWIGGKKYSSDNPNPTPEDIKKMKSLMDRLGPDYKYALIHDNILEFMADTIYKPND